MTDSPNGTSASAPSLSRDNGIEAHGLVREFKGGIRAVDGIDFEVRPGEIYGFLGPNGAGKSTTVHMLDAPAGHRRRARIAGHDVATEGALVRDSIGAALQEAASTRSSPRTSIRLQGALHGMSAGARRSRPGAARTSRPHRRCRPEGRHLLGWDEAKA